MEALNELGDRQARIARNEAAFRSANEQIQALNAAGAAMPAFQIVCECGSTACLQAFTVAVGEYEDVRAHPDRLLIVAGHEAPDVESVVSRHGAFVVVEKHDGRPTALAEESDPRHPQSGSGDEITRRIAENEARFRDANENIEEAVLRLEGEAPSLPLVCECGRARCMKILRLSIEDYERARASPRYFVCSPGHEMVGENLGRVVERTNRYVIVEKLGEAGEIAEERDTRFSDNADESG